jgi:glycosyltransferase involved in cell wall biosynthesis
MKIMHVIGSLAAGGAEVFVAQLCSELCLTAEVHLYTFCGVADERGKVLLDELKASGVIVHETFHGRKHGKLLSGFMILVDLARVIRSISPDIVNAHGAKSELFVSLCRISVSSNTRYCLTVHNTDRSSLLPKLFWPLVDNMWAAMIACGPSVLSKYPHFRHKKGLVLIANGIRVDKDSINRCELRERLAIPSDKVILLSIGCMDKRGGKLQKGHDILFAALSECLQKSRVKLILLGDGTERKRFEELVVRKGLSQTVEFRGKVANPRDYMQSADLLVMPSRFEGLSIVSIEAACAGLPMLLSRIEEFKLFETDSTVYCDPGSVGSLGKELDAAITRIEILKVNALRNMTEYHGIFEINVVAGKYLDLYKALV